MKALNLTTSLLFVFICLGCSEKNESKTEASKTPASEFNKVSELLSDSSMDYTTYNVGDIVQASEHHYEVIDANGKNDLITAGGLKLKVLPTNGTYNLKAYGEIGNGELASDVFTKAFDESGTYLLPEGLYLINKAIILQQNTTFIVGANARVEFVVGGPIDNLVRNANATAPKETAITTDTSITYATHPEGAEVKIGSHRYITISASATNTDLVNANGVKLIPALDKNISIIGQSFSAVFDQNGIENTAFNPSAKRWSWVGFLFEGVDNLQVSGFTIEEAGRWGLSCHSGCYNSKIYNMNFNQLGWRDGDGLPNQDCVNIRHMSSRVYVGHLYGTCGDDSVALTGLEQSWTSELASLPQATQDIITTGKSKTTHINMNVPYRPRDISYITIENINTEAVGSHHKVRLLGSDDVAVHHIFISNMHDTTTGESVLGNDYGRTSATAAILIGSARYGGNPHPDATLMHNIHINNISTLTRSVVRFQWSASDVYMSNLTTNWSKETDSPDGKGQEAFLMMYDYEDAFPPPPGFRAIHERHILEGAAMLHDGGDGPDPGDFREAGIAVLFEKDLTVKNSVYRNVYIKEARHAVKVGVGVLLDNVSFENFTLNQLGQMAFRVEDYPEYVNNKWSARNFTILDRGKLWEGHVNLGEFYSNRNNMALLSGMPDVVSGETAPEPVVGSHVRFSAGTGGFANATNAVANGAAWVAQ